MPHFSSHPPPLAVISSAYPPFLPIPPSSVCQCLDHLNLTFLGLPSTSKYSFRFTRGTSFLFYLLILLSGDVELNPGPSCASSTLKFSLLNIRSASTITPECDKPAILQEFISDKTIDILSLTETWLSSDSLPSTLNSLTPSGYSFINAPRLTGRGGGIALIFRSFLKIHSVSIPLFPSFESLCVRISSGSVSHTLLTIYRPPSLSETTFISDFSCLLEHLFSSSRSQLIITGDFNFDVNDPGNHHASSFLQLLSSVGLQQLISFPTHDKYTLDLLITNSSSDTCSNIEFFDPALSDHYAILADFSISSQSSSSARSSRVKKQFRNIKAIDPLLFSADILSSPLYTAPATTLSSFSLQFSSIISSILDKHAPLKTFSGRANPPKPYITKEILTEKSKRSKLESLYRKCRTALNLANFKAQAHLVKKLITKSRANYFRTLISNFHNQPKKTLIRS